MEEQSLTLSQLIGETVSSVRWVYDACNKHGLQEFHSFIKLANETIINIPVYDDEVFFVLNEKNRQFFQEGYNKGRQLFDAERKNVEGKVIDDILFSYNNGQISEDKVAYLKLSNGYYLTEVGYRPPGIKDIGIFILRQNEFEDRIRVQGEDIKSYLKDIR